jgi:hypothetical protein
MALTALADAAATAFRQGISGELTRFEEQAFRTLDQAIRFRLTGDRRAEHALAAVERDPRDERSGQALARELSYYAEVDPDFGDRLDSVIRRLRRARGGPALPTRPTT